MKPLLETLRPLLSGALAAILGGALSCAPAGRARPSSPRPGASAARELAAANASRSARRILPEYRREVLRNGLVVLIAEKKDLPLVDLAFVLRTGSVADPLGKEGLADLTLELTRHGAGSRDAASFDEAVESLGATLATSVEQDSCEVSAEFLAGDFATGVGLLADLVQRPTFTAQEFEKARSRAVAQLFQSLEDPSTVANRRFARFLFGDHPYGRPVDGTPASLKGLSREEVVSFHARTFVPGNAILGVVGDVETGPALARLRQAFGGEEDGGPWTARPVPRVDVPPPAPIHGRKVMIVDRRDVNQTQIRIGNVGIARSDPDYFPALVANTILGVPFTSWLNQEIREKRGLSYGARSSFEALRQPGPFVVSTFTRNDKLADTVEAALQTLKRFRDGRYTEDDLKKAQNYRAGLFPLSLQTSDQIAGALAELELYGLPREFYDRWIESVRAVALDDLGRVARRILPVDDAVIVAVSPAATARTALEAFGPVAVEPLEAGADAGDGGGGRPDPMKVSSLPKEAMISRAAASH